MRSVILAVVLALTATLAFPVAFAKAGAPVLSVGDFWEFETTIDTPNLPQTSLLRTSVEALESVTASGGTFDAYRSAWHQSQSTTLDDFSTTTSTDTTTWSRVSDGATLKSVSRSSTSSTAPGFPASTSDAETTYSPPCVSFQWPLAVGETWTATCASTTKATANGQAHESTTTMTTTYKVLRSESVTVPAGTFDALVIASNATDNNTTTSSQAWYAPRACSHVKVTTHSDESTVTSELKSFKCAKAGEIQPDATTPTTTTAATQTTTTTTNARTPTPGVPGPSVALVLAAIAAALLLARRAR